MRDLLNWIVQRFERNLFGPIGSFFGNVDDIAKFARGEGTGSMQLDSFINSMTGAGPTGVQLWQAEREDTTHLRTVSDMLSAGLNPAMMYSGGHSVDVSSPAGSPTGISDLLQLALLPLQMKQMQADIDNTNANTRNTEQRTRTEEQLTTLQSLIVQFYPETQQTTIDRMVADIDKAYVTVSNLEANTSLIHTQNEAQQITNDYLPGRLSTEIARYAAETDNYSSSAKLNLMRESFERIQRDFARSNKFLMSSSDSLMIVVYIANLLGLGTESIKKFLTEDVPHVVEQVVTDSHLGTPGGPHK